MSKRSLPWLQFYPADWLSDSVAGCSPAARGIWIDMLCIMHMSPRYGYLEMDGKPIPDELMFRRCGCKSIEEYRNLLAELFDAGVPSRTAEGTIYNRRMVRDQQERDATAARVRRHRKRVSCNAPVTPVYRVEVRSHRSEVRSQNTPQSATASSDAAFAVFWERWPQKRAKQSARTAWMKIPPSEYPVVMSGLEKWRTSDQWKRGVIPHPATWLNEKRWEDEDIPQFVGGTSGNHCAAAVRPAANKYAATPITRATA